jgi:polyisoprenoid-binding protein YceI
VRLGMKIQVLALTLSWASLALAQAATFKVEPEQSQVAFTLGDVLHTVHGTFHVSDGSVTFDTKKAEISGVINVAAGSGNSGSEARDRKMTGDILEAPRFAVASFRPEHMIGAVAASGDSTVQVSGVFTVHGSPHPLTVPMALHIQDGRCTAKTHFVVPYVQCGMKDPSTFVLRVAKEVSIDVVLLGQVAAQ